jgi:carbon storage regulator
MLVLSRQRDETIMIGDDIEITVVDIRGDKVRVGITAPARIAVHRKEVYDAIKAENEQAARVRSGDVAELGRELGKVAQERRAEGGRGSGITPRLANPGGTKNQGGAQKRAS